MDFSRDPLSFPHSSNFKQRLKMTTFHPFPRLIPELRSQIWALATEDRIIRVESRARASGWRSPTPAPAVTRACHESRELCNDHKSFASGLNPCYIWVNFNHNIIHIQ